MIAEPVVGELRHPAVAAHRRHPGHQEGHLPQPRHDGRHPRPRGRRRPTRRARPPRPASSRSARQTVTVPAGGTASVDLTVEHEARRHGRTARTPRTSTATGGGQTVRTAAAVQREVESYDVTLKYIGRDGQPAAVLRRRPVGISGLGRRTSGTSPYGRVRHRQGPRPQGRLHPRLGILRGPGGLHQGRRLAGPAQAERHQEHHGHGRRAHRQGRSTSPCRTRPRSRSSRRRTYTVDVGDERLRLRLVAGLVHEPPDRALGPEITDGSLYQQWGGTGPRAPTPSTTSSPAARSKQLATGYTKHYKASELATVKVGLGASATRQDGRGRRARRAARTASAPPRRRRAEAARARARCTCPPATGEVGARLRAVRRARRGRLPDHRGLLHAGHAADLQGGQELREDLQHGGLRPARRQSATASSARATTSTATCRCSPTARRHAGYSLYTSVKTTLYRNGTKVGENADPLVGERALQGPGRRRRVQADHLDQAQRQGRRGLHPDRRQLDLPLEEGRRAPSCRSPRSASTRPSAWTAGPPAGKKVVRPGDRPGRGRRQATSSRWRCTSSYDDGQTWKKVTVKNGKITREEPGQGQGHLLPRQDHRQEGQQVDDLDLQRVLREVSRHRS